MPNIMIPAQAVIHLLQSQRPLRVKCLSLKRGIIQSVLAQAVLQIFMSQGCFIIQNAKDGQNIYRILPKVNQVIYTLDTICMPNIMILA